MKNAILILTALLLVGILALFVFTKVLGPKMIFVSAPKGEPIGEFDVPRPEVSLLAVTIGIPIEALEAAANAQVPERMQDSERGEIHKRIKNGSYAWDFVRGPIQLQNTGSSLAFATPIEGSANFAGDIDARLLKIPLSSNAEIGGILGGTLSPEIGADWKVDPRLVPQLELTKAKLDIGGIGSLDIGGLLGNSISKFVQKEARKLTPAIRKQLSLKQKVAELWSQAYLSEHVSDDPMVWVNVSPQNVLLGPIDYSNPDQIGVTVAIEAETFLTNREPPLPTPAPLPDLQPLAENTATRLQIPLIVSLAQLNEHLATENIDIDTGIGTKLEISGLQAEVGQEGYVNLRLDIEADQSRIGRGVAGQIWVRGRPLIDLEAQTLGFSDVELTVETRDKLTTAAAWLLDELLVRGLESQLRVDLNDYKEEIDEEVQKAIQTADLPEGIDVSVQNLEIGLADIYTITRHFEGGEPDPGIVIVLRAEGDMKTQISELLLTPDAP